MSVEYYGGMLVGCHGSVFKISKDCPEHYFEGISLSSDETIDDIGIFDKAEFLGIDFYSEWYDSGLANTCVGFPIDDVEIDSLGFEDWVWRVKELSDKFEEITGIKATLIGCQDIR